MARTASAPATGPGFVIPAIVLVVARDAGIPVLALAALALALAGAKALRRRRRRVLGPPAARVAGAWRELIDLGRDLGIGRAASVAPGPAASVAGGGAMTRREFAAYAEARGLSAASAVAVAADAATFGPADPDGAAVARVWQLVETSRRDATAPLPRWRRAWVTVNPASLWASRAVIDRAVARARRAGRRPAARGSGRSRGFRRFASFQRCSQCSRPAARRGDSRRCVPVKLKITLERPQGATDLVLTAAADATVGDVATALTVRDPDGRGRSASWLPGGSGGTVPAGAVTLTVLDGQRVTLDPALPAADSGIKSGDRVTVAPAGDRYADRAARPVAQVTVLQGPDAGQRVPLPRGNITIGRGNGCDLVLSDTLVSRRHVRLFLAPGSAEILDLGSANGITLNDEPVTRGSWLPGDRLRIGDTVLGIEFAGAPAAAGPAHAATAAFNRSPVITGSYAGQALETPELPETERPPRFQLLPLLAPFVLGGVLFAVTKTAVMLIFVALSPLMMVANVIEGRMNASRGTKGSMTALRRELGELGQAADEAHAAEWRARNAEHPPTAQCLDAAARRSPLLWSRRPGAPRFLDIRVGAATLDSRLRFETQRNRRAMPAAQAELDNLVARYRAIRDVPFTLSLTEHGAVGIAGDPIAALDVSRAVLCQLAALHSPAEVVLTAFCGGRSAHDWDWLKWLPHTSSAHSPITGPHLVAGPESVLLLAQLEDLVRARLVERPGRPGQGPRWRLRRARRQQPGPCRGHRRRGGRAHRQPYPRRPGQARRAQPDGPGGRRLLCLAGAARRAPARRLHRLRRRPRRPKRERRRQHHVHVHRGHRRRRRRRGDRRQVRPGHGTARRRRRGDRRRQRPAALRLLA